MSRRKPAKPEHWPSCIPGKMDDYAFRPNKAEREAFRFRRRLVGKLRQLESMERRLNRLQERRIAHITAEIAVEAAWLERERQWEERLAAVQNYYLGEREKEEQARDRARREKCACVSKEISRAAARAERNELARRGVYRGRGNRPLITGTNHRLAQFSGL